MGFRSHKKDAEQDYIISKKALHYSASRYSISKKICKGRQNCLSGDLSSGWQVHSHPIFWIKIKLAETVNTEILQNTSHYFAWDRAHSNN